jgi:hypothetical protein
MRSSSATLRDLPAETSTAIVISTLAFVVSRSGWPAAIG